MAGSRKLLLFLLVICTLGYGSAWAYDGHAVNLDNDAQVNVVSNVSVQTWSDQVLNDHSHSEQTHEQHSIADAPCDHCGHISAHLQAIFSQNNHLSCVNQSSELLEFSETFISFIGSPDLRPPRV